MALAHFRRAGGSTIVTLPPAILKEAGLSASSVVDFEYDVDSKAIIMRPARPRYTMSELLAQCDLDAPLIEEDQAWLGNGPAGREAI